MADEHRVENPVVEAINAGESRYRQAVLGRSPLPGYGADRVLWVDDEKPARPGYAVARTYHEALRMLRAETYDVLCLDYDLGAPGCNGVNLLEELAEYDIPIPAIVRPISSSPFANTLISAAVEKIRSKYDRKCDMAAGDLARPPFADALNALEENDMREVGLEPTSPKAPDPKARPDRSTPDTTGSTGPVAATERQPAAAGDTESTTESTTDGGSDDEPPSGRALRPVPILARTPESACSSCGSPAYWSIEEFTGLNVLVSIEGDGSVAPTRYHEGVGILHVCAPNAEAARRREVSPL